MARRFAAVVFSLGCVHTSSVLALGLGEMTLGSYLNEPLQAQVDLLNIGGLHEDQIKIRLATSEDFKRMGVDRAYFLTGISFEVDIEDDGRARILITSEDPVLEPYLDFILEARWPSGRLLREYTVLVDPPVFDQSNPVVSASSRVAEVDGEPAPAKKKQEALTTTGTRVDIGRSELAPGEMPSRGFNSSTSPAAAPGTRYMVHRDDTLWRIASRARPAGASVQQTMLEIQRLNPNAFIGGNINLIKAGYIIYLPAEGEVSTGNESKALAEVSAQNRAWREEKVTAPGYGNGPSLRISAETEAAPAVGAASQGTAAADTSSGEEADKAGLERLELEQRLSSMEQQLETLQRIVSLKDEQIAALQNVLAGNQAEAETGVATTTVDGEAAATTDDVGAGGEQVDVATTALEPEPQETVTETVVAETTAPGEPSKSAAAAPAEPSKPTAAAPAKPAAPASKASAPEASGGIFSNLWLGAAALVLGVLGIIYMRRRRQEADDDDFELEESDVEEVFEDEDGGEQAVGDTAADRQPEADHGAATRARDRGYGEHKHDEYASDEASDALAEAEIYIAYGRYPQAIDLLKNALVNDPENAAYRLKLLQLYLETGNRSAASLEFAELEQIGDAASLATARAALDGGDAVAPATELELDIDSLGTDAGLLTELDENLESDFSGLEIEEPDEVSLDDELDLSADFENAGLDSGSLGEELVIAAESNGMSTKLDLARAYMDMGDDDGARQILEEVAAEGNEELQAEARDLLERIG